MSSISRMVRCALQYVARRQHEHQAAENAAQVGLHRSRRQLRDEQVVKVQHAELEQIRRAMLSHPDLVAGEGRFDTELMRRSHGQVLSKGGAEGIQCLSRVGEGLGVAIKVEDGSRRAKQAVALHLLRQLEWLTPMGLDELDEQVLVVNPSVKLRVSGSLQS